MVLIDIPLTLIFIWVIVTFSLLGIIYLFYITKKLIKIFAYVLMNVPMISPHTLNDLEERAKAIKSFQNGDPEPLKKYWDKIFEKEKQSSP